MLHLRRVARAAAFFVLSRPSSCARSAHHASPKHHSAAAVDLPTVLVYSRTAGYRHASIPTAIDTLRTLGASNGGTFAPTFSEDPGDFTDENLSRFDVLAFLSNSDQILDDPGIAALGRWLTAGGGSRGLIGLHSATAALFNTSFYGVALGAFFDYHPDLQNVTFTVVDANHPSTSSLPARWDYVEEAYNWRSDPRDTDITVLLSLDLSSFTDPQRGARPYNEGPLPQPIAWYRDGGIDLGNGTGRMPGRMWYTALGHTDDAWNDPTFQGHILGGFQWVLATSNSSSSSSTSSGAPSSTGASSTGASAATSTSPSPSTSAASPSSTSAARLTLAPPLFFAWSALALAAMLFLR